MKNSSLKRDFSASIVVFLVALPLCMGVAIASGGTVIQGILAGVIGGIVVGLLSGSHVSVSGPAAGLIVIVETALNDLKVIDPVHYFSAFATAVLLAGIIQLILGAIKLGVIADFIPVSVIKGMLAAIGIIMILKQLPHVLGYDGNPFGDEGFLQKDGHNTFSEIIVALQDVLPLTVIIGVLGIAIQVIWEMPAIKKYKFTQLLPAPLLVVVFGVALNELSKHFFPDITIVGKHMVSVPVFSEMGNIVGASKGLLNTINWPDLSFITNAVVLKAAVVIAIIASIESLLSLEAGDKIDPEKRVSPPNRELFAQGVGNILAGIFGAMPVTAVIVRTSANVNGGAKSRMSAVIHGIWLLLFVLALPVLINQIPNSALAAVLIFVGYKLAKPKLFKEQFKKGNTAFYPFVVTILAILLTDLLIGITIGMILGFYYVIKSNFHKSFSIVKDENNTMLRFHNQASFLNKSVLKEKLSQVQPNEYLLIDFSNCTFIDSDICDILSDFKVHAKNANIQLEMKFLNDKQERELFKMFQSS
jgi:MFS superfamily sulfate permease-like transporter